MDAADKLRQVEENLIRTQIKLLKHPIHFFSLGFGAGLVPFAPGTIGTLVAVPLYWCCQTLSWQVYSLLVALAFLVGCWLCDMTAKALGASDPAPVVWDEMVGYFVTMIMAPAGVIWIIWGFVLFRFFDILKPWPIRWVEQKIPGGVGIMVDDLIAGIMAAVCLKVSVLLL